MHLDPSIYLMDEESKLPCNAPEKGKGSDPVAVPSNDNTKEQMENSIGVDNSTESGSCGADRVNDHLDKVSNNLGSMDLSSASKG